MVIHPNDHRPAHIQVIGSDAEAVFHLNCPAGPVTVRENYGFSRPEITRIGDELLSHLQRLCDEREKIHGND